MTTTEVVYFRSVVCLYESSLDVQLAASSALENFAQKTGAEVVVGFAYEQPEIAETLRNIIDIDHYNWDTVARVHAASPDTCPHYQTLCGILEQVFVYPYRSRSVEKQK